MAETRRKLTTILSADVQDYTRLMGKDEEGTLATLRRHRERMSAIIGLHGGRVVNTWGDGLIAEFPSVVEAVRAAIDVQNELAEANSATPDEARMMFRIGINLGDVIEQDDDLYGDGVNIAARLQSQAPAGGIVISSTVYDHVRNKLSVGFDFLGELTVKNVHDAIPSYSVRVGADAPARTKAADAPRPDLPPPPPSTGAPRPLAALGGNRLFPVLGGLAALVTIVNVATWDGHFWAAWPLLVFATIAGLAWTRDKGGAIGRYGPPAVFAAMLLAINIVSGADTLWAQWPILVIAAVTLLRWVRTRPRSS
jgi:class 3 adenylate cyclase